MPELVVLGEKVAFEVIYDADGTPVGGREIDDPDVVRACRDEIASLHAQGEPLLDYFEREIAPLGAPIVV